MAHDPADARLMARGFPAVDRRGGLAAPLLEIDVGKLLPVVVAYGTMHGGVYVAGTMLPNSRTTLRTSITGKSDDALQRQDTKTLISDGPG